MRRAITSRCEREEGFTLVELLVAMLVMAIVGTAVIAVAMTAFSDTATITNRRAVFGDGQFALNELSKQLRQGESIDPTSTASQIKFSSYIAGSPVTILWRVTGSSAPYSLQESRNGGTSYYTVTASLTANSIFTYSTHGGVVDEVAISLPLGTRSSANVTTSTVLKTDIHLRNAET